MFIQDPYEANFPPLGAQTKTKTKRQRSENPQDTELAYATGRLHLAPEPAPPTPIRLVARKRRVRRHQKDHNKDLQNATANKDSDPFVDTSTAAPSKPYTLSTIHINKIATRSVNKMPCVEILCPTSPTATHKATRQIRRALLSDSVSRREAKLNRILKLNRIRRRAAIKPPPGLPIPSLDSIGWQEKCFDFEIPGAL